MNTIKYKPISISKLDEIFCNSNIELPNLVIDIIAQYSQFEYNFTMNININISRIDKIYSHPDNVNSFKMNVYSSISLGEIRKRFDKYIRNMSIEHYFYLMKMGYLESLLRYNSIPKEILIKLKENEKYFTPTFRNVRGKYCVTYLRRYLYSVLNIAQRQQSFIFYI